MLHVRWNLMWNVTQSQLGETSAPACDMFLCTACIFYCALKLKCAGLSQLVTTYHVTWGTSVESVGCSVKIILAEYVLFLQFKKKVDNFPMEQGPCTSSPEFPSFNGN